MRPWPILEYRLYGNTFLDATRSYLIHTPVHPETRRGGMLGYHNPNFRCVYIGRKAESLEPAVRVAAFFNVF